MKTSAAILFLMVMCAMSQVPPRVMDDLMWQATKVPAPASGYLNDRTYFKIVTASNAAPVTISVTAGTTTTIEWGDGDTTNNVSATVTHTYVTAGSYQMTIRGGATAFNFNNATSGKLKEILTPLNGLTNLTTLDYTFYGCTGLTGSIPVLTNCPLLTSLGSAFLNCSGLTGHYPSLDGLTALTSIANAFEGVRLNTNTSTVAYIFGAGNFTNLTTANSCFSVASLSYAGLQGTGSDFTNKTFAATFTVGSASTNSSYRMFYNQTNITDWSALGNFWR